MRLSLALFAVGVAASAKFRRQESGAEQAAVIGGEIGKIRDSVTSLATDIGAFASIDDKDTLQDSSDHVVSVIEAAVVVIEPLPGNIGLNDAVTFADSVSALGDQVNDAVDAAIDKKPLFVSSCVGPLVLAALQDQLDAAVELSNTLRSKLDQDDPILASVSEALIAKIQDGLKRGIEAFADQTSYPPGCESTTTTTSAVSTTTESSETTTSVPVTTTTSDDSSETSTSDAGTTTSSDDSSETSTSDAGTTTAEETSSNTPTATESSDSTTSDSQSTPCSTTDGGDGQATETATAPHTTPCPPGETNGGPETPTGGYPSPTSGGNPGSENPGDDDSGNDDSGNDDSGNDGGNDDSGNDDSGNDDSGNDDGGNDDYGNDDSGSDDDSGDDNGTDETGNSGDDNTDDSKPSPTSPPVIVNSAQGISINYHALVAALLVFAF